LIEVQRPGYPPCRRLLAGFEISSVGFLVTVSEDVLDERPDEQIGTTVYRHVNIAVAPSTPSRS
jgi:hypothetical protein